MTRTTVKLIREGDLAADVEVALIEDTGSWSPYLSRDDAMKLDRVRRALRDRDLAAAARLARVYQLVPVSG